MEAAKKRSVRAVDHSLPSSAEDKNYSHHSDYCQLLNACNDNVRSRLSNCLKYCTLTRSKKCQNVRVKWTLYSSALRCVKNVKQFSYKPLHAVTGRVRTEHSIYIEKMNE